MIVRMDYIALAQDVMDCEIEGLQRVRRELGDGFSAAVTAILNCLKNRSKVVITGMGKNLHIAEKISATLASTGTTSVVLNPAQAMHGDLGILQAGDVLLALSYSGESDEILAMVPLAKRMHVTVVAVTGVPESDLAKHSDIILPAAIDREACPFNMAPTTSTTATLALGDALAMVLLEARGFKREDYAKLHPSGAIGRALLLRVRDIMRQGDRVALVPQGAAVKDALLAMTEARAGSAGITDGNKTLLGIFTDGDLRRHIGDHDNILDLPIETLMTSSPITVREDELAVDVLKIFEDHNIDDLLVVDAENRVVGAVDIQDLPKLKIM
jgi:arabinose-5-phosphate isomerase